MEPILSPSGRFVIYGDHLNAIEKLEARVAELEDGLESCAEHLELALSRLGCPTNGNDGGSHGHDADGMGGVLALDDARDLLNRK